MAESSSGRTRSGAGGRERSGNTREVGVGTKKRCREVIKLWEELPICAAPPQLDKRRYKRGPKYADIICAFDIETYTLNIRGEPTALMYLWQFQAGFDCTYIGRTWDEYRVFIEHYTSALDSKLVIYVHNLHYEFSFLKSQFIIENVFAKDKRHIVRADIGDCEYRCSAIHSNMSLAEYTTKYEVAHAKLVDTVDYYTPRFFDTQLEDDVIKYGAYDVMGLVEAIQAEMDMEGDNLYTIPLTSTGYVRREARQALYHMPNKYREGLRPCYRVYQLERQAFRGGDTHANRAYVGIILENVKSVDLSSAYPYQLTTKDFPIGEWRETDPNLRSLLTHIVHRTPFLAVLQLHDVHLRNPSWGFPYIPVDKCRGLRAEVADNGRVLEADFLEITVTDIDFQIITEEYDCDIVCVESWVSKYGKLPDSYIALVQRHYRAKTELKGVEGQEVYYNKEKNRINSFYGLTAQNPVNEEYEYDDGLIKEVEVDIGSKYGECKPVMPYAWGVWCTAHARLDLHRGLKILGDNAVYVDTDSIKYLGDGDLSGYNANARERAEKAGSYATDKHGEIHYMGVFEEEAPYDKFLTWGAKKYAYEQKGELGVTIAGVGKKEGAKELAERGGLKALRPDFCFKAAGGLEAHYNDYMDVKIYHRINADGTITDIPYSSNLALTPSTYTLGLSDSYALLIANYASNNPKNLLFRWVQES